MAAAINPADINARAGRFQALMPVTLPAITGYDFAGIVTEVGSGTHIHEVGAQ